MTDAIVAQPDISVSPQVSVQGQDGKGSKQKPSSLPAETVEYLKAWMMSPQHIAHPYPTEQEKAQIMADTNIELKQLTNWFVNNRKRYWKPRVEARLQQQAQAAAAAARAHAAAVAVVTAATRIIPVSPDIGFRSPITFAPNNGFVSFDLRSHQQTPIPVTDFSCVMAVRNTAPAARAVSETSSSASVTSSSASETSSSVDETLSSVSETSSSASVCASEGEMSDSTPEDEYSRAAPTEESSVSESQMTTQEPYESPIEAPQQPSISWDLPLISKKRELQEEVSPSPRKKFRLVSCEIWRDTCQSSDGVYCATLPSLEEATLLFGYAA